MKWENRGIYDVEQANIPKFSKLDDAVTTYQGVKKENGCFL